MGIKNRCLAVLLCLLSTGAFAQQVRINYYSTIWWNEANFKGHLSEKFFYQVDFQYRTGSDGNNKPNGDYKNPFDNMMQMQFRPFFGYNITEGVKFSIAPSISPTWSNTRSIDPKFNMEYRFTAQLQFDKKYGRVAITHRDRFEYRMSGKAIASTNSAGQMFDGDAYTYDASKERFRFRYMLRALIPINNNSIEKGTFYVNVYDEIFIAFGKNVSSNQTFDQNRINIGLGYRMARDVRFEIGYLQQVQMYDASTPTSSVTNAFHNNGVQVFLIFNDMKKLFKGEEAAAPVIK